MHEKRAMNRRNRRLVGREIPTWPSLIVGNSILKPFDCPAAAKAAFRSQPGYRSLKSLNEQATSASTVIAHGKINKVLLLE